MDWKQKIQEILQTRREEAKQKRVEQQDYWHKTILQYMDKHEEWITTQLLNPECTKVSFGLGDPMLKIRQVATPQAPRDPQVQAILPTLQTTLQETLGIPVQLEQGVFHSMMSRFENGHIYTEHLCVTLIIPEERIE